MYAQSKQCLNCFEKKNLGICLCAAKSLLLFYCEEFFDSIVTDEETKYIW